VRTALVLGGTGMLAGCARQLVERGWQVVLPSRTQPLMADDGPGRAARASISHGDRPTWIRADWTKPHELAAEVQDELQGREVPHELAAEVQDELQGREVNLLVAWVHGSYRVGVLRAVQHLLAEGAPVVEVHTCAPVPDPVLPNPTQQVLLGHFAHDAMQRTSRAVLDAVERALEGRAPSLHHEDAR
jgi:NAD(P)-dependent dehydrogenase (short-subunit alcohol dehydrogenase family)